MSVRPRSVAIKSVIKTPALSLLHLHNSCDASKVSGGPTIWLTQETELQTTVI